MKLVQAKFYTPANRSKADIRLEVLHAMQAPEKPNTAENVAAWFGRGGTRASAHYCFDNDSEIQSVLDKDVAWAAPGANHDGRHYELAGYAQQTRDEWTDPFSLAMLVRCALVVSKKCDESGNSKTWLSEREVELGRRGITHHLVISKVYKKSTHWDVGYNFPVDLFIDLVRATPLLTHPQPKEGPAVIMQDCVASLRCPVDGGLQKLQADGGVFNDHCEHFHGSYPGLGIDPGNPRQFKEIVPTEEPRRTTGYSLVATSGEVYDFPA